MPVVTYQRKETISRRTGQALAPKGITGGIGKEVAGLGVEFANLSNKTTRLILDAKDRIARQDAEVSFVNLKNAYDNDERTFLTSEIQRKGQDTYDNLDRADEFAKQSLDKYVKDEKNPYIKGKFLKYINTSIGAVKDKLAVHKLDQRTVVAKKSVSNSLELAKKDAYAGLTTIEEGINRFGGSVIPLTASGVLGKEEGAEVITKGTQEIAEAYADGLINRDPIQFLKLKEAGVFDKYMKQEKIKEYDTKAKTIEAAVRKDLEAKKKEAEKAYKEAVEENIADYFIKKDWLNARKYLETAEAKRGLAGSRRQDLIKEMDTQINKTAKGEKGPFETTDSNTYALAIIDVTDNPDQFKSRAEIRAKYHGKGVGNKDIDNILNLWDKYKTKTAKDKEPTKTDAFKAGLNYLKQLDKEGYLYDYGLVTSREDIEKGARLLGEKTDLLQDYIEKNPTATREQAIAFIDEITKQNKEGFVKGLLQAFSFGLLDKTAKAKEETKTPIPTKTLSPEEEKLRNEAIKILQNNKKMVTEQTIQTVIERLKNARSKTR